MKLGDLFWVKLWGLKKDDYHYKDTIYLQKFIKEKFGYDLSFIECYEIWSYVSGCQCASWLGIPNKEEVLANMLKQIFE